jgi:hypothetical protein
MEEQAMDKQHEDSAVGPDVVTEDYGGTWIAWDHHNVHIVAKGATIEQATTLAQSLGVKDPTLEFVPPSDAAFVGGV